MSRYTNPAIRQLTDQQVRYAPRAARLKQMDRAEKLVAQLDSEKTYSYQELCESITSYRPTQYPDLKLSGEEAAHDLRCFVEDLSDSVELPAEEAGEPVLTVKQLSEQYNVSTKTVDRWRDRGLVSRRFVFGNRKRIGFLKSSVERFVDEHADEVHRGRNFSQLSESEREEIVRRARRLARYGGCPADISRRLARKLGRSPETIRYTLKNFDEEHPEAAVFPHAGGPLTDEQKREIFRNAKRGVPAERLARKYCRTKASVYRIVSEVRASRLLEQPIDYMDSPEFHKKNAEEVILGPAPEVPEKGKLKAPPGLPPYLASLYSMPLLTREQEAHHFRKMNFLKFQAAELRKQLDSQRPKTKDMDRIEQLLDEGLAVKNFLIRSNLRLVVSIAKRGTSSRPTPRGRS
ncbi:MAG: RNA polymerase subunit sigma-70 [Planctomycetaceae bacterium]